MRYRHAPVRARRTRCTGRRMYVRTYVPPLLTNQRLICMRSKRSHILNLSREELKSSTRYLSWVQVSQYNPPEGNGRPAASLKYFKAFVINYPQAINPLLAKHMQERPAQLFFGCRQKQGCCIHPGLKGNGTNVRTAARRRFCSLCVHTTSAQPTGALLPWYRIGTDKPPKSCNSIPWRSRQGIGVSHIQD